MNLNTFQKGEILIDGQSIKDYNSSDLRENLGLVSQDVFLFSDTIINNITLFNDSISENEVWRAIEKVGAEKFINSLFCHYIRIGIVSFFCILVYQK